MGSHSTSTDGEPPQTPSDAAETNAYVVPPCTGCGKKEPPDEARFVSDTIVSEIPPRPLALHDPRRDVHGFRVLISMRVIP